MIVVSRQRILFRQKRKYICSQWMSKEGIVYLLMILNVNTDANVILERSLHTNETSLNGKIAHNTEPTTTFITSMTAIRIFSSFISYQRNPKTSGPHHLGSCKILSNQSKNYRATVTRNKFLFQLDDSTQIQLENAKTRDFHGLLNRKTHTVSQTEQPA